MYLFNEQEIAIVIIVGTLNNCFEIHVTEAINSDLCFTFTNFSSVGNNFLIPHGKNMT